MAALLTTIQQVCERLAQAVPTTVIGSTDKQTVQMKALVEEGLEQLRNRGAWERLTHEYTFTTLAAEDQGTFSAGLGSGPSTFNLFDYILPQTLWDRTQIRPLVGPLDAQDWQALKAWVIQGPHYQFRLRGGHFYVNPAPTAGLTWAFEYVSEATILSADGLTYKKLFTLDTDDILLPDAVVKADLKWRWKKAKGLSYAQDFEDCEQLVVNALARKKMGQTLHLDSGPQDTGPKVAVPIGNWNL